MPAISTLSSGNLLSGGGMLVQWNKNKSIKVKSLDFVNASLTSSVVILYDCFTTNAAKTMAAGVAVASEDIGVSTILSGRAKVIALANPSATNIVLDERQLEGIRFIGGIGIAGLVGIAAGFYAVVRYEHE